MCRSESGIPTPDRSRAGGRRRPSVPSGRWRGCRDRLGCGRSCDSAGLGADRGGSDAGAHLHALPGGKA
ncbi:hypothetical protein [Ornithinimicrobium kibberense]|uniref:hypothetical protein n=1 Tax=Ornithinimicrobium kibberense TaxID=282060 RepID=UPI0036063B13